MPLTGEKWAAGSEAYAACIAQHLTPQTRWLDAGTGSRLLEGDLDTLENWLVQHCGMIVGIDVSVAGHLNIRTLIAGSLYALPFANRSFNLVTCNVVMEHLGEPQKAVAEVARVLVPDGAFIINTPNLWNYGVLANALLSKVLPEKSRLKLVRASDSREPENIFPVHYRANTLGRLHTLLGACGFRVHSEAIVPQQRPHFRKTAALEKLLMALSPGVKLLVCAHKQG